MTQTVIPTNTALVALDALEQERKALLSTYHPHDHLAKWVAFDKRSGRNMEVVYYPAAWRLYELSLRYTNANFSSDIIHMDAEKDFVIVRARLYLGADYASSVKKAEAYKQGKLTELDKVETKAKARAARDFGIGTEHALDMDDLEAASVPGDVSVQEERANGQRVVESGKAYKQLPAPQSNGQDELTSIPTVSQLKADVVSLQIKNADGSLMAWQDVLGHVFKKAIADGKVTLEALLEQELTPDACKRIQQFLDAVKQARKAKPVTSGK